MKNKELDSLRSLTPIQAVQTWLDGAFGLGDEPALIAAIRTDAQVRLSDDEIINAMCDAMDEGLGAMKVCSVSAVIRSGGAESIGVNIYRTLTLGEQRNVRMRLHDWQTLSSAVTVLRQLSTRRDIAEQPQVKAQELAEQLDQLLASLSSSEDQQSTRD